jgi:hypothetical protein
MVMHPLHIDMLETNFDLDLHFPLPDGIYSASPLLAETLQGAYKWREYVFDVYVGSKPNKVVNVLQSMDMFAAVGGAKPIPRKFNVSLKRAVSRLLPFQSNKTLRLPA